MDGKPLVENSKSKIARLEGELKKYKHLFEELEKKSAKDSLSINYLTEQHYESSYYVQLTVQYDEKIHLYENKIAELELENKNLVLRMTELQHCLKQNLDDYTQTSSLVMNNIDALEAEIESIKLRAKAETDELKDDMDILKKENLGLVMQHRKLVLRVADLELKETRLRQSVEEYSISSAEMMNNAASLEREVTNVHRKSQLEIEGMTAAAHKLLESQLELQDQNKRLAKKLEICEADLQEQTVKLLLYYNNLDAANARLQVMEGQRAAQEPTPQETVEETVDGDDAAVTDVSDDLIIFSEHGVGLDTNANHFFPPECPLVTGAESRTEPSAEITSF